MKEQVITIDHTGAVETLLKDSFFDTRFLGHRKVERISEINFDENEQKFYINWLLGPWAGFPECERIEYRNIPGTEIPINMLRFDTYELAVEHEIKRVNAWRLAGETFGGSECGNKLPL